MSLSLFSMTNWNAWREARLIEAKLEVGALTLRDLLGDDLDAVAEKIACKLRREPAVIDLGGATCTTSPLPPPTVLSLALGTAGPKLEMTYTIPFTGDPAALEIRPTVSCCVGVKAVVEPGQVRVITHSAEEWERVKAALADTSARLADELGCWNSIAVREVRGLMAARHSWLRDDQARREAARVGAWAPARPEVWLF